MTTSTQPLSTGLPLVPVAADAVPVAVGVAQVHAVLDAVEQGDVGLVTGRDVAEVDRAMARLASVKLRMVAAAHRQEAGARSGMTGTAAWLAAHTRSWGGKAASEVSLATALDEGMPATRQALAAGALSTDHAAVIAGATSRLPEGLTRAEREQVEASLVAQARRLDPAKLRRAARRALEAAERSAAETLRHEDAELRGEEARAEARVRLTMHDNHDGTVTGHFTIPALAGAILRKTIQQMVSPRRHREASSQPAGSATREAVEAGAGPSLHSGALPGSALELRPGDGPATGVRADGGSRSWRDDPRDWAQKAGDAFVELVEHLPTDRLSGKVAATVVVTVDHEQLRQGLGAARLDTGHDLSASEARRLACSAGVLPAVLGGASLPLDLGRTRRFFTEAQRVALATVYDECAADGCDRPYAWTDLHHEDPWSHGGRTDLSLAVPLCGQDHRRAHDPRYESSVRTDPHTARKSVRFRLRT